MGLQRMRTVRQLAKEYKIRDPDTAINEYFLRRLIASGAITL
jgi:hypothetical protein